MKKLFIILGVMLLSITNLVQAQRVWVGGKEMTLGVEMNSSNNTAIKKGSVSWAEGAGSNIIITLDNVTLEPAAGKDGLAVIDLNSASVDRKITVIVKGENTIKTVDNYAFYIWNTNSAGAHLAFVIQGAGASVSPYFHQLNLISNTDAYYQRNFTVCAIRDVYMTVNGDRRALTGDSNSKYVNSIEIGENALVHIQKPTSIFAFGDFGSYNTPNNLTSYSDVLYPSDVAIRKISATSDYFAMFASGEIYKGELVIGPKITDLYYYNEVSLVVGQTETLDVSISPRYAWKSFTWGSTNSTVASVDNTGKITAKAHGTTTVTAIANDGSGKVATFNVSVGYPLWVGGIQVRKDNAANITGTGITGKASFNATTNTLTLNGASITKGYFITTGGNEYFRGIFSELSNLNIVVVGSNSINPKGNSSGNQLFEYGIQANKIILKGTGSLNITTTGKSDAGLYQENYGIYDNGNRFEMDETVKVSINSLVYGLYCKGLVYLNNNSSLESYGKESCGIYFSSISDLPPNKMEGDTKAAAVKVDKFTTKPSGNYFYTKPYVSVSPSGTGLASLHSQGIQVRGGKGEIYINVPEGTGRDLSETTANVYNLSGALVRTAELSPAQTSLKVDAGIYIVRIGNGAEKVVVH